MERHLLIDDLHLGFRLSMERKVRTGDVLASVEFAQDYGGYHVDEAFARTAGFRTVIASGIYHNAMIAGLAGRFNLLGREMTLRFAGPIYEGDLLRETAEVIDIVSEKRQATLDIRIVNPENAEVVSARLTGYLPAAEWGMPQRSPPPPELG
jgi:acyl dehydratase